MGNRDDGFLFFMVGVLIIGLIGLGYFYFNGDGQTNHHHTVCKEVYEP